VKDVWLGAFEWCKVGPRRTQRAEGVAILGTHGLHGKQESLKPFLLAKLLYKKAGKFARAVHEVPRMMVLTTETNEWSTI
jgi:hypothetical protein